jgi:5-methylcytosine-specific restriction endonuclease McrA
VLADMRGGSNQGVQQTIASRLPLGDAEPAAVRPLGKVPDGEEIMTKVRQPLAVERQVQIFFRDHWLCHWCRRPVIFAPALKYLQQQVQARGYPTALAYFDPRWRRDAAPLLDELAAVIDHRLAHVHGGAASEENLVTACNKCNLRKNSLAAETFVEQAALRSVKGRYGEPVAWDGLVALFLLFSEPYLDTLTAQERKWRKALLDYLSESTIPGE